MRVERITFELLTPKRFNWGCSAANMIAKESCQRLLAPSSLKSLACSHHVLGDVYLCELFPNLRAKAGNKYAREPAWVTI